MYILPYAGLGQARSIQRVDGQNLYLADTTEREPGRCSGWMSDPESFSKVVADYYLQTEYPTLFGQAEKIWCSADKKMCQVYYPNSVAVGISFVNLPHFVIARRYAHPTGPRCEYDFNCLPSGQLVLKKRRCAPS